MTRTKSEWRRHLIASRAALPIDVRRRHEAAIVERAGHLSWFEAAAAVLGYEPMGAEVDPGTLLAGPQPIFLPTVPPPDGELRWKARHRASAEGGVCAHQLSYPLLAIVPGVGYDLHGRRLGRGRGHYDRALTELRRHGVVWVLALAFECQVVPALPTDPWDALMDAVVTERRVIDTLSRERPAAGAVGVQR